MEGGHKVWALPMDVRDRTWPFWGPCLVGTDKILVGQDLRDEREQPRSHGITQRPYSDLWKVIKAEARRKGEWNSPEVRSMEGGRYYSQRDQHV